MLIVFVVVLLFFIGPLDPISDARLPLIYVIYGATGSKSATNVLVSLVAVILFFALFNIFASVSRLVWVFATDKGLPFSDFFAYVSRHPINFTVTSALIYILSHLIPLAAHVYITIQAFPQTRFFIAQQGLSPPVCKPNLALLSFHSFSGSFEFPTLFLELYYVMVFFSAVLSSIYLYNLRLDLLPIRQLEKQHTHETHLLRGLFKQH
jgi:hypothetical protein